VERGALLPLPARLQPAWHLALAQGFDPDPAVFTRLGCLPSADAWHLNRVYFMCLDMI